MLVELKAKSQVTIPKDIVNSMELNQGDQFEVTEDNGKIILVPVAVYPEPVSYTHLTLPTNREV